MRDRISKLQEGIERAGLDALLVTNPRNLHYLFGMGVHSDMDILGVVGRTGHKLLTDSRYWEMLDRLGNLEVVRILPNKARTEARGEALNEAASQLRAKTIGFEAAHLPFATVKEMTKTGRRGHLKFKPATGLVEDLRLIKDEQEIALIRRAAEIADQAFANFVSLVRPGMTEKEGAWLLESFMRTRGAEALAFDPIVASGPNAALPHAVPTERAIQAGEPVTLDFGARVEGYHSDLTRTICLGTPDDKFTTVYKTVLAAQKTAERKIRAGMQGKKADRYARRVIEKAGQGEYFGHGTSHGVGLQIHEGPSAGRTSKDTLRAGMTLTIEPGIYIPGWGGVRIEDLTLVHEEGLEVLSQASKDPVVRL